MKKKIKERFEQMKLDKIENSKKRSHKIKEMWAEKDFRNKMQKIINSEEHKLKLSEASKKMWSNKEYRKMQSEKHKGNVSKNKKRIAQYDLNGNFIKEYESIQDASIKNNINSKNISSVCKGKRHKAGKYIWKYI
jgi:phage gp45-like